MKIGLIALGVLTAVAAFAQDPPSRVARLSWVNGNVSFQPAGVDTWTDASLNYPLTTGDHIYTDVASRAEMRVGPNAIRLNGETNVGFLNLDDRTVQARFTEGSLEIRLRHLDDQDLYEVDTPQGAASLLRAGDYRFDTDPGRNATMITVMSGEAEVSVNGRTYVVHPRQTAYFAEGQEPDIREANQPDDFDRFTADRNLRDDRVPPPVHVSQGMIGYEDLDAYGSWRQTPDYGWAWAPRVVVGWAPYHHGRWAWVEPWGWTWVDEAPWGFAPFHYGRWANSRGEWLWVPGAVVARPVYAPALVVFVGGPRFGVSISFGGGFGGGAAVGWFPLGPREPYYPSYHVSNAYVQQVNVTHVTNVTVINNNNVNVTNVRYANQQVPGAVMAMPQRGFASARPVSGIGQTVRPGDLAQAQVGMNAGVAPGRESMLGPQGGRQVAAPSQAVMARQVVAKSTPPPPAVSFQARQQMLQQNGGRPLAPEQMTQLRQQQPAAVVNRAPVRSFSAPAPAAAPVNAGPAPAGRQFGQQPNRMDSRPPNARPLPSSGPVSIPGPQQVAPVRPMPEGRPTPEARPIPESRPVPEARPVTPAPVRPQPEFRPAPPQPEFRPAPPVRPIPEARPIPESRPVPEARPVRPMPETRPQPEVRPAPPVRPQPEAHAAAPAREERRAEKKAEKDKEKKQ